MQLEVELKTWEEVNDDHDEATVEDKEVDEELNARAEERKWLSDEQQKLLEHQRNEDKPSVAEASLIRTLSIAVHEFSVSQVTGIQHTKKIEEMSVFRAQQHIAVSEPFVAFVIRLRRHSQQAPINWLLARPIREQEQGTKMIRLPAPLVIIYIYSCDAILFPMVIG